MAELYVKPGNRERGWNDPPQFSYGLQQLQASGAAGGGGGGGKRGILTRRPAAAPGAAPAPPPQGPAPGPESATCSAALSAVPPPPVGLPPPPGLPPGRSMRVDATNQPVTEAGEDCHVEDVLAPLNEALANCRRSVPKQVCDDISKRLGILQQMWVQGKLSAPVRKGMKILTQELKRRHWDAADEIHRSLIVDHVTEVSQWMVGVKRLIAEARNLHTEDLATEDYGQKIETSLEPECQLD